MKKLGLSIIVFISSMSVLAQDNQEKVIQKIDHLLEKELNRENVHNVFFSIYSPSQKMEWHIAKGEFRDGTRVTTETPYYTASVGKTFTATAVGILVDQGKINFNDPIADYLADYVMDSLHVFDGVDYSKSITIAQLLQHTSGVPDYFDRQTLDGSPTIFDLIMTDPNHFWKPEELIGFSKTHFKPSFAPGTGYYYTDTEYVLLGMIIEEVSGLALHDFFEQHFFAPLSMKNTYLNLRSSHTKDRGDMAEIYAGEYEISSFKSLSADWAGGAIVSTGKDLIKFQLALMNGELISGTTLEAMQQWINETKGMSYGFGLRKIEFRELFPTLSGKEVIGHSGLNGTSMYYCPDLDIYLAGTLNQLEASKDAVILMAKVLAYLENYSD